MKLLDLYCGAGGCACGYTRAGFEVVGVDHLPQPRYLCSGAVEFIQADALEYLREHGREYDVIHASPPCQAYSRLRHLPWLKGKVYPDLLGPTRDLLEWVGKPWVIENVEFAPLGGAVLCGLMFGLPTFRHRRFESSNLILGPAHPKHTQVVGYGRRVNDRGKGTLNAGSSTGSWGNGGVITVAGGQFKKVDGERALGIDWMSKAELAQAIPPVFTEYIGHALMAALQTEGV